MANWNEQEYEVLFRDHPPTEAVAPTPDECAAIARALGTHSQKAVASQWDDGRSLVLGHTTDAARPLRDYLVRRGWL